MMAVLNLSEIVASVGGWCDQQQRHNICVPRNHHNGGILSALWPHGKRALFKVAVVFVFATLSLILTSYAGAFGSNLQALRDTGYGGSDRYDVWRVLVFDHRRVRTSDSDRQDRELCTIGILGMSRPASLLMVLEAIANADNHPVDQCLVFVSLDKGHDIGRMVDKLSKSSFWPPTRVLELEVSILHSVKEILGGVGSRLAEDPTVSPKSIDLFHEWHDGILYPWWHWRRLLHFRSLFGLNNVDRGVLMLKHHWWRFNELLWRGTSDGSHSSLLGDDYHGHVLLLDDDHRVSADFLAAIRYMVQKKTKLGGDVWGATLARIGPGAHTGWLVTEMRELGLTMKMPEREYPPYSEKTAKYEEEIYLMYGFANAGIIFNRTIWGHLWSNRHHFWGFPADWDKTIYHFCQIGVIPQAMLVPFVPRLYHVPSEKATTTHGWVMINELPQAQGRDVRYRVVDQRHNTKYPPNTVVGGVTPSVPCLLCDHCPFDVATLLEHPDWMITDD